MDNQTPMVPKPIADVKPVPTTLAPLPPQPKPDLTVHQAPAYKSNEKEDRPNSNSQPDTQDTQPAKKAVPAQRSSATAMVALVVLVMVILAALAIFAYMSQNK